MSTFTPSKQLEQVPRGGDPGTWDAPTNNNWAITDAALGGIASINLTGVGSVTLTPTQFQSNTLNLTGTLSGNVQITFPTSFYGPYTIMNYAANCPTYNITLLTTAPGSQVIGCRPWEVFEVLNDGGGNMRHRNLPHPVGGYWDFAGYAVPNWVNACTIPPYLNCNGTAFSSATYPALNTYLGTNILP